MGYGVRGGGGGGGRRGRPAPPWRRGSGGGPRLGGIDPGSPAPLLTPPPPPPRPHPPRPQPTFIKIGQQFSTRVDVLAPEFVKELEKLQVRVGGRGQRGLGPPRALGQRGAWGAAGTNECGEARVRGPAWRLQRAQTLIAAAPLGPRPAPPAGQGAAL
jgi:hypothetical protein